MALRWSSRSLIIAALMLSLSHSVDASELRVLCIPGLKAAIGWRVYAGSALRIAWK
jgi:hypothetical protein